MLGEESKLSTEAFVRVANELPKEIIEQLFGQSSEANDIIIEKLLNNPKVDLGKLASLLADPQIALGLA
jgi:Mg/Co/Ni transporter MgtE